LNGCKVESGFREVGRDRDHSGNEFLEIEKREENPELASSGGPVLFP